jgi:hypothetical protein
MPQLNHATDSPLRASALVTQNATYVCAEATENVWRWRGDAVEICRPGGRSRDTCSTRNDRCMLTFRTAVTEGTRIVALPVTAAADTLTFWTAVTLGRGMLVQRKLWLAQQHRRRELQLAVVNFNYKLRVTVKVTLIYDILSGTGTKYYPLVGAISESSVIFARDIYLIELAVSTQHRFDYITCRTNA